MVSETAHLSTAIRALARRHPVFDAHADSLQRALDLGHDLGVRGPGQLDLERGAEGGLGSLVFVSWVDPRYLALGPGRARERACGLLRQFHTLVQRHPERVRFAGNARLAREAHEAGAVAGIPGIEGGHALEEDPANLDFFFERGVRVLTLVWNNHLSWIRSCQSGAGAGVPAGLSELGRDIVRRMNRLGMVVDVSHAGERSFYEVLETVDRPVIASHSGCKSMSEHPRNLDDEQLRALAENGGVLGIVFCTAFLDPEARAEEQALRRTEAYLAITGENDTDQFVRQAEFLSRVARPVPIERVADHVCHAVEVAGIDHVGLGSDFDGIQRAPRGLEGAEGYMNLAEVLARRGFGEEDLLKVLGRNMERVFEAATARGTRAYDAPLISMDGFGTDP